MEREEVQPVERPAMREAITNQVPELPHGMPDNPEMPEPDVLRLPDGEGFDDDFAVKCAWGAHGYDTGMEPFFSADRLREFYAAGVRAGMDAMRQGAFTEEPSKGGNHGA